MSKNATQLVVNKHLTIGCDFIKTFSCALFLFLSYLKRFAEIAVFLEIVIIVKF